MNRALPGLVAIAFTLCTAQAHADERPDPEGNWGRIDTQHLTVYGNVKDAELTRVAAQLERIVEVEVRLTSGTTAASTRPTYVFVFRSRRSMEPFLGELAGAKTRVGGVFWPGDDANFSVLDYSCSDDPTRVLYHEWTHYFTNTNLPWLPMWLHEGLAEYFSTTRIEEKYAEVGRTPEEELDVLSTLPWRPWSEIFAWDNSTEALHERDEETTGASYAQAWALTHLLLQDVLERTDIINRFLDELRKGETTEVALRRVYGLSPADLDQAIKDHVFRVREHYLTLSFPTELGQSIRGFDTPSRAELLGRLGDLLAHNSEATDPSIDSLIDAALAEDANSGPALTAEGFVRLRRDDRAGAIEALTAAASAEPRSVRAQSLLGHACMAQWTSVHNPASALPDSTPPLLLKARDAFRAVTALAPDRVDERIGLAQTYVGERGAVWEGLQVLNPVLAEHPDRQDALELFLHLMINAGNLPGAWNSLEKARAAGFDSTRAGRVERHLTGEELRLLDEQADSLSTAAINERLDRLEGRLHDPDARARVASLHLSEVEPPAAPSRPEVTRSLEPPRLPPASASFQSAPDIASYNRAVRFAREGKVEDARGLFQKLARESHVIGLADSARVQLDHLHLFDRYHEALRLAELGELDRSIALLDSVAAAGPRWGLREEIQVNRRRIAAAKDGRAVR